MSQAVGSPTIMTIRQLSERLGIHRATVLTWITNDPKWRGCVAKSSKRKIWLSVQRLVDNGLLPRPEAPRVEPMPGLSFAYETKAVGP